MESEEDMNHLPIEPLEESTILDKAKQISYSGLSMNCESEHSCM